MNIEGVGFLGTNASLFTRSTPMFSSRTTRCLLSWFVSIGTTFSLSLSLSLSHTHTHIPFPGWISRSGWVRLFLIFLLLLRLCLVLAHSCLLVVYQLASIQSNVISCCVVFVSVFICSLLSIMTNVFFIW